MKKIKIRKAIEKHTSKENYVRLTRKKGGFRGITTGFILKMSSDFILIQETDEFRILGYQIIPIKTIKHVRRNKNDKTYENILFQEGLINQVGIKHKIDLSLARFEYAHNVRSHSSYHQQVVLILQMLVLTCYSNTPSQLR